MSKFLTFGDCIFPSRELLIEALGDLGWSQDKIEEGEHLHLFGYQGDRRNVTADLVIRRKHVGSASNDLGFAKTDKGYIPIISEFDAGNTLKVPALRTAYHTRVVEQIARRAFGRVVSNVQQGSVRKLVVSVNR